MGTKMTGTINVQACISVKELADLVVWAKFTGYRFQTRSEIVRIIVHFFHEWVAMSGKMPYICQTNEEAAQLLVEAGIPITKNEINKIFDYKVMTKEMASFESIQKALAVDRGEIVVTEHVLTEEDIKELEAIKAAHDAEVAARPLDPKIQNNMKEAIRLARERGTMPLEGESEEEFISRRKNALDGGQYDSALMDEFVKEKLCSGDEQTMEKEEEE